MATQASNAAGEETTSEQFANLAKHYFTFHHRTRNFRKPIYVCRNAYGSERNYVATEQGVLKARTVRRLQPDFKYDLALLNKVSGTPWAPKGSIYNPSFATLLDTQIQQKQPTQDAAQQTNIADGIVAEPATKQQRTTAPPRLPSTSTSTSRLLPDGPMATSPTGRQHPPLPAPPRQTLRRLTRKK